MICSEIHLAHFSLSHVPPPERYAAAAQAGFYGVSLSWKELKARLDAGESVVDVSNELNRNGVRGVQIEFANLPSKAGLTDFELEISRIVGAAVAIDCGIVHAVALDRSASFDDLVMGFRLLADQCQSKGLRCGIEFIPYLSEIPDLESALRLVRKVDRMNAGVVLDTLHFLRSGSPWDILEKLSSDEIVSIQVNDALLTPPTSDYYFEAMHLRRVPGTGEFDMTRFLESISRKDKPMSLTVEVMSDLLAERPAVDAAKEMADGLRGILFKL